MNLNKKEILIDQIISHFLTIQENNNTEILAVRLAEYTTNWLEEIECTLDVLSNQSIEG